MGDGERRRRRVRGSRGTPPPPVPGPPPAGPRGPAPSSFTAQTSEVFDDTAVVDSPTGEHPIIDHPASAHDREDRDERSLRGLIGGGSSQVNVRAAMRARDASRPSDEDLADAEATLAIVHRGWVPRDS